jgi:hypothetical protein
VKGSLNKVIANSDLVPPPNNLGTSLTEFPAFARIDLRSNFIASRGQSQPVWEYTLPDLTTTRVGTSGIYAKSDGSAPVTAMSQLGAVPGFEYFRVPGFPNVKFDQFPGAPVPFGGKYVAFKGNFTDGSTSRTGVYFRNVLNGKRGVRKIADSTDKIPGTSILFGSTAPPSAADSVVVFVGVDVENAPTAGGIYSSNIGNPTALTTLAKIGDRVPGVPSQTFSRFGESLSWDGTNLGFWGAWGTDTRTVRLYCPVDGNNAVLQECRNQCPDQDATGYYCDRQVPVNQGVFVRDVRGRLRMVARAGAGQVFKDFLFWTFSGRPPGVGSSDDNDFELPRWRSSSFIASSPNGSDLATMLKGVTNSDRVGIFLQRKAIRGVGPVILLGDAASSIDARAPAGAVVTAVGMERDGFRDCKLGVAVSFLNSTTSESWAGIYLEPSACTK